MELLILKASMDILRDQNTFKFQYGATNIRRETF